MPQVYDSTPSWVRGLEGAGSAAQGFERRRQRLRDEERQDRQDLLRERTTADESRRRDVELEEDLKRSKEEADFRRAEREREGRERKAATDFNLWALDVARGRRPSKIPQAKGPGPLAARLMFAVQAVAENQAVRKAIANQSPEDQQRSIQFLQQQAVRRTLDDGVKRLINEVREAAQPSNGGEPWMDPGTAQRIEADLLDANQPHVNPIVIEEMLEREREHVAKARAASATFQRNIGLARTYMDQPPPPGLNVTPAEWLNRVQQAQLLVEQWELNWTGFDPAEKLQQVSDVLFDHNAPPNAAALRQELIPQLLKMPDFLLMSPPERAALMDELEQLVLAKADGALGLEGGAGTDLDGIGGPAAQGAPAQIPEDLRLELDAARTSKNPQAAVKKVLQSRGLTDPSAPETRAALDYMRKNKPGEYAADEGLSAVESFKELGRTRAGPRGGSTLGETPAMRKSQRAEEEAAVSAAKKKKLREFVGGKKKRTVDEMLPGKKKGKK